MIKKEQLEEAKEILETAQNPLFLFDNDVDGFCSFLLLRRSLDRGKGVAIKTYPDLQTQYLQKVEEFQSDLVVVLDKAEINKEFIEGIQQKNIPLLWIDHHKITQETHEGVHYYNSQPTAEPTTYIAHNIFKRKQDEWIALIGCIGDVYMPEFAKEFAKKYPELLDEKLTAFEALHATEMGKLVRIINFGLMDTTTNVVKMMKYLFTAQGPHDLFEENNYTKELHKRYKQLNEFYKKHTQKAEQENKEGTKTILYTYSGEISMSSEIANKLYYKHPESLIIVVYKKPDKANISIRGKNALKKTKELIEGIEGATGGGHEEATGAMVPIDHFEEFKKRIENTND